MSDAEAFAGSGPRIEDQSRTAAAASVMGRTVKINTADGTEYTHCAANDKHGVLFYVPDRTRGQNLDSAIVADDQVTVFALQRHQLGRVRITNAAVMTAGAALQHAAAGVLAAQSGDHPTVAYTENAVAAGAADDLHWVRGA